MTVEDRKAKEEELMSLKAQRDLLYKNRAVALSYGIDGENFSNNEVIAIDQEIDLIMRQISSLEFEISNASIIEVAKPSDIPSVGYGCKVLLAIDYGDEKEESAIDLTPHVEEEKPAAQQPEQLFSFHFCSAGRASISLLGTPSGSRGS